MAKTKISWTEANWNPVVGCSKVSPGCKTCYAEKMAARQMWMSIARQVKKPNNIEKTWIKYGKVIHSGTNRWNGKIYCDTSTLDIPLKRRKPTTYFVCSMGDLFHEKVPFRFIEKVMATIEECPQHTFQILTKRPYIMAEYFNGLGKRYELSNCPNLWLGISCENQKWLDIRAPLLLQIPYVTHFLSIEPLLSEINLNETSVGQIIGPCEECGEVRSNPKCDCCMGIPSLDWIILGCESNGSHLGRMGEFDSWKEWLVAAVDIVQQCKAAGVPVFVKQIPKLKYGNRTIKWQLEKNIENFPKSLQHQEWPRKVVEE